MKTQKTTTKEINAASIARVSDKSGKFLGYLVKSNSSENYYEVTYNESASRYECNCASSCKCCHIKAVEQVQAARHENSKIIEKPQQDGTIEVVTESGKRVATIRREQQAPTHEGEGTLPQETRQALANWHQSVSGDAMEREYTAPKYNFNSLGYPTSGYRKLDSE